MCDRVRRRWLLLVVIAGVACGNDGAPSTGPGGKPGPQPGGNGPGVPLPPLIGLEITPRSGFAVAPRTSFSFSAVAVRLDGQRVPVTGVSWASLAPAVIQVNAVTGDATAGDVGTATIVAQANGLLANVLVTVYDPQSPGSSTALTVNAFSIVEFAYPSQPGQWYYAPQVNVRASPDHAVLVLDVSVKVPGLYGLSGIGCDGVAPAGASRDLNGEVYGDWTFAISSTGTQSNGEDATLVLTFVDDAGARGTITSHGKVERGGLPTTYTGGQNGGLCFHGYVPP